MIYRDVTEISSDNNSCNTVVNDYTIYGFTNNRQTRYQYVLIEDKYYKSQTSNSNYGYDISNYVCLDTATLTTLPAHSNYYVPFYAFLAFALSVAVFGLTWFAVKSIFGRRV